MPEIRSRENRTEYPKPQPETATPCPKGSQDMRHAHADHDISRHFAFTRDAGSPLPLRRPGTVLQG